MLGKPGKAAVHHAKKVAPKEEACCEDASRAGCPMPEQQRAEIERERQKRIKAHERALSSRMGGPAKQAMAAPLGLGPLNIFAEGIPGSIIRSPETSSNICEQKAAPDRKS
jgi:hypothetical protein